MFKFCKLALLEVWESVTHPLLIFQKILGLKTKNKENKKNTTPNGFLINIFNNFLSRASKQNKHIKKYTAAYFDRNANPKKTPNNKKFFVEPLWRISKSRIIEIVQKNNKNRSVEIKNEERLTAGNTKKDKEHITELFLDKLSFRHNL